jgi:hypothetical protein
VIVVVPVLLVHPDPLVLVGEAVLEVRRCLAVEKAELQERPTRPEVALLPAKGLLVHLPLPAHQVDLLLVNDVRRRTRHAGASISESSLAVLPTIRPPCSRRRWLGSRSPAAQPATDAPVARTRTNTLSLLSTPRVDGATTVGYRKGTGEQDEDALCRKPKAN